MTPIEKAAYKWWKHHRPCAWNELAHLENPTINIAYDEPKALAKEVAKMIRKNYNRDGSKKK